jgi:hypothetical protein
MRDLKIEVEKIEERATGDYEVIVRANLYEKETQIGYVLGVPLTWTEPRKAGSVAEFIVRVAQRAPKGRGPRRRTAGRETPIEQIKRKANAAVLDLCREILKISEPRNPPVSPK